MSLVGTISTSGCHIHISLADSEGHMIGGHLVDNDIIFTTAEVSLIVFDVVHIRAVYSTKIELKPHGTNEIW